MPSAPIPRQRDRLFATAVVIAYFCAAAWGISRHEMWRDEYQAWMLAQASGSLADLYANMRYEGHPMLWHSMLWVLAKLGLPIASMQALHLLIATTNAWLIARYFPYGRVMRVLACCGYYVLYEYALISRNYGLMLLFALLFCVLYREHFSQPIRLALVLALLANTHLFGTALAAALLCFVAADVAICGRVGREPLSVRRTLLAVGIVVAGISVAIWQIVPPADAGFLLSYEQISLATRVARVFGQLPRAYFPLPRAEIESWNTHLLFDGPPGAMLALGVLSFLTSGFALLHHQRAAALYLLATVLLLALSGFTSEVLVHYRHIGCLYIALLASFWMKGTLVVHNPAHLSTGVAKASRWVGAGWLWLVLSVQAVGGIIAYGNDLLQPFSNAADAARIIESQGLADYVLVGSPDAITSALAGALDRPFYYLETHGFGTYIVWNKARRRSVQADEVVPTCRELMRAAGKDVVLVLLDPVGRDKDGRETGVRHFALGDGYYLHRIASADAMTIAGQQEHYHVHVVDRNPPEYWERRLRSQVTP